jgi:hypothetical protein
MMDGGWQVRRKLRHSTAVTHALVWVSASLLLSGCADPLDELRGEIEKAKTDLTASMAAGAVKPYVERKAKVELLEAQVVALKAEYPHAVQKELDTAEIVADAAAKQASAALQKRRAEVAAELAERFDPKITGGHFQPSARSFFDAIVASERSCNALYEALKTAEYAAYVAAQRAFQWHDSQVGRGMIRRARVC